MPTNENKSRRWRERARRKGKEKRSY